jgi:ATP-NAD kinase
MARTRVQLFNELTRRTVIRSTTDSFHNPRAVRYRRGRTSAEGYYRDSDDIEAIRRVLLHPVIQGGTFAARAMAGAGVGVIVTLGGDGMNRLVAVGAGETPLLPIPAGTNNAFAEPVEPTVAGVAAGLVARGAGVRRGPAASDGASGASSRSTAGPISRSSMPSSRPTLRLPVAGRAVWDPRHVIALMVTQAEPGVLGLSGLVAAVRPVGVLDPRGAYLEMGSGTPVGVLLTPGVITPTEIRSATCRSAPAWSRARPPVQSASTVSAPSSSGKRRCG